MDKTHSITRIAAAAVVAWRFIDASGAYALTPTAAIGVSEAACEAGRAVSVVTDYSIPVEAYEPLDVGDFVRPAPDGSGRAAKAAAGDACGRVLSAAAAAGKLAEVRFVEQLQRGQTLVPQGWDYAAILKAALLAKLAGGGHVALLAYPYTMDGNTLPVIAGVTYSGSMPTTSNPKGDAPDIGAVMGGAGTRLIGDGTAAAFAANTDEGAIFTGYMTAGTLTVTAVQQNQLTGKTGKLMVGSIVRGAGIPTGQNFMPIIQEQLTGVPGGVGTYRTDQAGVTAGTAGAPIAGCWVWNAPLTITGVSIRNMAFQNVKTAVQVGAFNAPGLAFSQLENLLAFNTTDRSFDILNYEHLDAQHLYGFYCVHAQRICMYASGADGGYGNSTITHIYNQHNNSPYSYGIELGAGYNHPGTGGLSHRYGFIQNNHYNRVQYIDAAVSTTAGSPNIGTSDGTKFPLGMPVRWITNNPAGFVGGPNATGNTVGNQVTYFVVSRVGNTIQISDTPDGAAINATATLGGLRLSHWGFPHVTIRGGNSSQTWFHLETVDIEGDGAMLLIDRAMGTIMHPCIGHDGYESIVVSKSAGLVCLGPSRTYWDTARQNSNIMVMGGWVYLLNRAAMGDSSIRGSYVDGHSNRQTINLAGFYGANPAARSFENCSPGNADYTRPGLPLGVRQGYASAGTTFNVGSDMAGMAVYTGAGAATWIWDQGRNAEMKGYRQTFKNAGGGALTVTLGGNEGTFDGMTGGGSAGKSYLLAARTATAPGGCLSMVLCEISPGVYQWQIDSLLNATLV
ncbi:MAG: hypothetical protein E6Q67_12980 [Roseateles sp.]|nr:MAG: hypothetical protein E6Q67_12980 [Roseateles sp.]